MTGHEKPGSLEFTKESSYRFPLGETMSIRQPTPDEPYIALGSGDEGTYVGLLFKGANAQATFVNVTCPCGVSQAIDVWIFPRVDTPHPCGKPNHWLVKYEP